MSNTTKFTLAVILPQLVGIIAIVAYLMCA